MKKKLAIILALVLVVSLLAPAAAFAATSDTYKVTFSLTANNTASEPKTVNGNYNTQSGSETLSNLFGQWALTAMTNIETEFAGTGKRAQLEYFIDTAKTGSNSDWQTAVNTYLTGCTGTLADAKAALGDRTKMLADLEQYSPFVFTYDANTSLTVTLAVDTYIPVDTTPATTEETTTADDGTEATEKKDAEGNVTEVEVKVPDDVTDTTVPVTADEDTPITIDIPDGKTVTVEIPVEDVKPTTVVKLVKADGTEEILPATAMTEDGLKLVLDDDVTIKIEDVEVTNDIPEDAWYKDAMDYVEAREILEDIPAADVAPLDDCDRGTFTTMLYNLCRQPDASTATGDFEDVKTADFYSDAVAWAKENNIVKGVSDTEFDGDSVITREQIVTILWRFAGCPAATAIDTGASDWAADAMSWAVSIGLIKGNGDDTGYRPQDQARVAEAATIIMDFVNGGYAGTSN